MTADQETIEIQDDGDLRKYFAMIPHLVDDLKLSPYAYRLYGHFKRVTGENGGKCHQSTPTLVDKCRMSAGMVYKARLELQKAGLIHIRKEKREHGGKANLVITMADIWKENIEKYRPISHSEIAISPDENAISLDEKAISWDETKKNPIKKNPSKKKEEGGAKAPDPRSKHPAILLVKGITGKFPKKATWDTLIQRLGDIPEGRRFEEVYTAWCLRGYSEMNLTGMLDWYENGIPANGNGSGHKPAESKMDRSLAAVRRVLEQEARKNGNSDGSSESAGAPVGGVPEF